MFYPAFVCLTVCLSVCLSISRITQKGDIFNEIFGEVQCVTNKNWLDFVGDLYVMVGATSGWQGFALSKGSCFFELGRVFFVVVCVFLACFQFVVLDLVVTTSDWKDSCLIDVWFVEMSNKLCSLTWCGSVANCWTCDQQVTGLNPGLPTVNCNPGQLVHTHASVTKQYNLVPANGRPPFRLAASVSWCWSWEKEGRAVEVIPDI